MEILRRASVSAGEGLDFVISDGSLDRHGTRINPKGWDLSNFKKNPIALFGHDSRFPIGTWSNIRTEGDKLVATLKLAAKGTSDRINEIISLIEQKVLRATSVGFSVIKFGTAGKDEFDFVEQELFEVSVVSVPSNTNALAKARALNVSPATLSLVFGESANERRGTVNNPGESAVIPHVTTRSTTMTTLSQRIVEAQTAVVAKRDKFDELDNAPNRDLAAVEAAADDLDTAERELALLQRREAKEAGRTGTAPPIARRPLGFAQKELKPVDLLVRKAVVNGISLFTDKPIDKVLEERYPDHDATHAFVRADPTVATTGGSHYVSDLQQTTYQGFIDALDGMSVFPAMRNGGLSLSLDNAGTAYVPGVAAGGANGSFFAEGGAIRVGNVVTNNTTLTSRKVGVILAFSREAAKRSTPDIEAIFRRRILADTAAVIDAALLDNVAQDGTRPGGLLYDQVATAAIAATASGYGGGDHVAVMEDFKALLAPFIAANAADGITVVMNPAQGLAMDFMVGPDGALGDWFARARARFSFVESTHATAGRLIAVRPQDFASAVGGVEFLLSNQATLHMEDASPAADVGGSTTPVRSLYQIDSMGLRMVMDINWRMMRAGMVRWINGTSW